MYHKASDISRGLLADCISFRCFYANGLVMNADHQSDPGELPIHPGEILLEQFLESAGIDGQFLAAEIGLPVEHIEEIIAAKRSICASTALRLARFLGTAPELWLHLQNQYDLELAREAIGQELEAIDPCTAQSND